ncbi:MAG TPA: inorganic phosphate transporter [Parachlamydiaceae bacterium]|nr:inorganic phosphate transporter [Parachlamydiaceae bacterium]
MPVETILLLLVLAAGFYTAWNIGANDVANAMGTSVGSGALTLKQAVLLAAVFEFMGALFFGSHVSDTIQNGLIDSSFFAEKPLILVYGMLAALLGTGIWLQTASYFGWPVSTTHSIVGGIIGFGAAIGGMDAIYWDNISFIFGSWIFSPILGGIIAYFIFSTLRGKIFYTSEPVQNAKKITPFLVFIFMVILTTLVMFHGLENVDVSFSFVETALICFAIALLSSFFSYLWVRRIEVPETSKEKSNSYNPEVILALEKAKKQLMAAQNSSKGSHKYQLSLLNDEIEHLASSYKQTEDIELTHTEYAIVEKIFGRLQIITACCMAFAHGANDVANAIGPLSAAINVLQTGIIQQASSIPVWQLALGGFGVVAGLATWGWRVIETIGKKITELTPTRGFAAEFGAATTVVLASRLGLPISTTHTLVGAVVGVGLARGIEALDLRTTRDIAISWIVTIPIGALITILAYYILHAIFG